MESHHFDHLARLLGRATGRRRLIASLGALPLGGLLAARHAGAARKKRRKKGPKPNAFGCLDVGKPCQGNDNTCCSGVCQGRKPKKGKKDTSRCVAHDASTCNRGESELFCGSGEFTLCTTSTGFAGVCNTTTGNAGYCMASSVCHSCETDADCQQVCGARGACLQCTDCQATGGTMCGSPDDLGCSAM